MKTGRRPTDKLVRDPCRRRRRAPRIFSYDADVPSFGARITHGRGAGLRAGPPDARGSQAALHDSRRLRLDRPLRRGSLPATSRRKIRGGYDPLAELEEERSAATILGLCGDASWIESVGRAEAGVGGARLAADRRPEGEAGKGPAAPCRLRVAA